MRRPHILLTFADDQRHSMLGCCNGPTADAVRTPHLDALARRGRRFTHAYHAGSPQGAVCVASRAMLHTGRGPFDLPSDMVPHHLGPAYGGAANAPTLAQLLRDAGYLTHFVGKWHNGEASLKRGFDASSALFLGGMGDPFNLPLSRWDGQTISPMGQCNVHATEIFSEDARDWLTHYAATGDDRPFFLCVAFTAPHDPRRTHAQWHERYNPDQITLPPNFLGEHPFDNGHLNNRDERLTPRPRDPRQTRHEIADYYAMTEHMDHAIGRIHRMLHDLNLRDDTLIIHSGDHGLAVGRHGLMGKQNLYDPSIRVPLLMAGPGIAPDRPHDGLCYQHDLFPTLLETAGRPIPADTPFRSLWPMLSGERAANYDLIGCYYENCQRMVTDGHAKFIRYHVNGQTIDQCFDLDADPWETIDPTGAPQSPSRALNAQSLHQWQQTMGDPIWSK